MILADVKLKKMVNFDTLYLSVIRLIIIPLLVWLICTAVQLPSLVTGISVILSSMPVANTTAILAAKYQYDAVFAGNCVVLSTLLSLLTTPLWCMLLLP